MNFAKAVRGSATRPGKFKLIQSSWETEFGCKMTDNDASNVFKSFSQDETYENIQKVKLYLSISYIPNFIYLSMDMEL